jgi:hypothetical protein
MIIKMNALYLLLLCELVFVFLGLSIFMTWKNHKLRKGGVLSPVPAEPQKGGKKEKEKNPGPKAALPPQKKDPPPEKHPPDVKANGPPEKTKDSSTAEKEKKEHLKKIEELEKALAEKTKEIEQLKKTHEDLEKEYALLYHQQQMGKSQ